MFTSCLVCHVRNEIIHTLLVSSVTPWLVCHVRKEMIHTLLMSCYGLISIIYELMYNLANYLTSTV
jgi:hypothetical protein